MKLYSIHCGYYDRDIAGGIYESHCNLFLAAKDFADAKAKAKANPLFMAKKMHVDGMQELTTIDGYDICLVESKVDALVTGMNYADSKALNAPSA